MPPIVAQLEYLEQQHILILLKSTESDESYGERHANREGGRERGREGGNLNNIGSRIVLCGSTVVLCACYLEALLCVLSHLHTRPKKRCCRAKLI